MVINLLFPHSMYAALHTKLIHFLHLRVHTVIKNQFQLLILISLVKKKNTKVFTAWLLLLFLLFHFYLCLYLPPFHRHLATYLQAPPCRRVGHYYFDWLHVDRSYRAHRLHRPSGVAATSGNSTSSNQVAFACCLIKLASALFLSTQH